MNSLPIKKQKAMSLLELLVAMAVLSILIVPMVFTVFNSSQQSVIANKEITLASYIAQNHFAELQLSEQWPSPGSKSGDLEFANKEWEWTQTVVETSEENLRRVSVTINYGNDGSFTMTGFVGNKNAKQK